MLHRLWGTMHPPRPIRLRGRSQRARRLRSSPRSARSEQEAMPRRLLRRHRRRRTSNRRSSRSSIRFARRREPPPAERAAAQQAPRRRPSQAGLSSPEQLAKWTLQARQEIATLETVIDTIKVKLFASELGAGVPVKSLSEAAKDALYEAVKDAVPFWRQMEAQGQHKAEADVKTAAEHFDAVDKA